MNTSHQRVITAGRAYVRLIEAADALLGYRPAWTEALLSRRLRGLVRALCRHRLRALIGALPAEMGAEIMAASEKIEGPCRGLGGVRGEAEHAESNGGMAERTGVTRAFHRARAGNEEQLS